MQAAVLRRLAPAASILSILLLALVSATPASPFQPLLPAAGEPSGPLRWLAGVVGLDALGQTPLAVIGVVSVVLAAAGFVLLAWAAWRCEVKVRTVLAISLLGHVLVVFLPLLFSRDVYSYAYYGRIASVYHANPYVATPADYPHDLLAAFVGPKWVNTPAVYGPVWVLISVGVVRIASNVTAMIEVFRAIAIVGSLGTLALIWWTVRRVQRQRTPFAIAAFGANPVVLFHSVASGHNDLLVALSSAGAFALVVARRPRIAIAVLALGALIKVTAALPLLLLVVALVARRPAGRRVREAAIDVGIAAFIALAFALPFLQTRDPTLGILELAGHEGWLAPSRFFHRLFDVVGIGWLARIAFGLGLVVAVVVIARSVVRWRDRGDEELGAAWGWALLLLVLLGPVLLPWYVTWVLPLAWLLPRVPRVVAIALSAALIVSQLRTEPSTLPQLYSTSLVIGHYVITPFVIAMLAWLMFDLWRRVRATTPLGEEHAVSRDRHQRQHEQTVRGAR
ncbi:MAG: glycosyltransferase 87 family protein [Actinomycetota bacterium]